MALVSRVERINQSDLSRAVGSLATKGLDARAQARNATHVVRLLGIVCAAEEASLLEATLDAGGLPAKRLLIQKLVDIQTALTAIGVNVTFGGDSTTPSAYNGGTEFNALATFMSQQTGQPKNQSIYPTSASSVTDPSYN